MAAPYGTRVSADGALVATKAASLARGTAGVARENLAEGLTAARDGLHETLGPGPRTRPRPSLARYLLPQDQNPGYPHRSAASHRRRGR